MFDFTKEKKEKYYKRAEALLLMNNLPYFHIDREKFTVCRNEEVKIHLVAFNSKTINRQQLSELKKLPETHIINDRYTKRVAPKVQQQFEHAYLLLPLDEEDR